LESNLELRSGLTLQEKRCGDGADFIGSKHEITENRGADTQSSASIAGHKAQLTIPMLREEKRTKAEVKQHVASWYRIKSAQHSHQIA
jgi:hypothetical protein